MKRLIILSLLAAPTAALACPPLNVHPKAVAQREEDFRAQVGGAKAIVYAVVERSITTAKQGIGTLRILHVYRGDMAVGERVEMRYAITIPRCPAYVPKDYVFSQDRGTYGVVLIPDGVQGVPLPFTGFQGRTRVDYMISRGLIVSAQGVAPSPSDPVPPYFQ
ncbi:hypothetical protein SAMN05428974_2247 [Sphingopyxis sp. YR583]|uniref:hypothetical protein n=1 Tax=Sphingopyxis sp. YR583 TaxID=1881047 RepID=UPI0008A7AB6E|nr:hypothetical protein [Sphingopyxis sp. YR583]SEH17551.1 hypothetical protein SAMN05428974_2247 [Sphingopyxis sp. YR583]